MQDFIKRNEILQVIFGYLVYKGEFVLNNFTHLLVALAFILGNRPNRTFLAMLGCIKLGLKRSVIENVLNFLASDY